MNNPILGILQNNQNGSSGGGLPGILQMFNAARTARNPMDMVNSMAQTNPQVRQTMDYIQQNGGNARQAFYNLAQQKGVDPNQILGMLK